MKTVPIEIAIPEDSERALLRFNETTEDGQEYDVSPERMKSLARLGLVRWCGGSRYELTNSGALTVGVLLASPVVEPPQCDLVTGDVVCTRPRGHSGRCLMLERKVFAAPVVERQPVAEVQHGPFDDVGQPQWVRVVTLGDFDLENFPDGTKFFTSPPAPVAVVLPERRDPTPENPYLTDADHEWNACLDKELNQ